MGHLQLSMWIKVHLNQDTLVVSEFSNFTILNLAIILNFYFWKLEIAKPLEGFELITYRFLGNPLTNYCIVTIFGKKNKPDFHVYWDRKCVTILRFPKLPELKKTKLTHITVLLIKEIQNFFKIFNLILKHIHPARSTIMLKNVYTVRICLLENFKVIYTQHFVYNRSWQFS